MLNRMIKRISLLIPIITLSIFLGSAFMISLNPSSILQSTNDSNGEKISSDSPVDYYVYDILGTEGCTCIAFPGREFSDTTPPIINVLSPPNNSLVLVDTIIYIEITDDFPAGAVDSSLPSFVPEYVYYHWNDATSNITIYDADMDEPPADDDPVKVELTLPSDEANATHVLYLYAVDYEGNWASVTFVFTTPSEGEETSVTWTTTTTTTTTEHRRTEGFLVIPMIFFLIGLVNVLTWRRRKKEI